MVNLDDIQRCVFNIFCRETYFLRPRVTIRDILVFHIGTRDFSSLPITNWRTTPFPYVRHCSFNKLAATPRIRSIRNNKEDNTL
jgi:hypothetical protein